MVKTGDKVQVKVLKIDPVARKLTLGLKQLTPSPWEKVEQNYPRGRDDQGQGHEAHGVRRVRRARAGCRRADPYHRAFPTRVRRVADIVQAGQEVEVRIFKVEPELKRIALSLLPAKGKEAAAEEGVDEDEADDDTPPPPKPARKVPLKGGLGDTDRRLF